MLKVVITLFILISAVAGQQAAPSQAASGKLTGRWRVTFSITGDAKKNLIFEPKTKGGGSFSLLDTGPNDKPVADAVPAAWSELTGNRVSFSAEVELPLGTCCRELGTLMFKGGFQTSDSITGKIVFVTSVDEEESPYKFHSAVGTFTATRMSK
jgi:hypothetical protein